ncbi:hypothetical protein LSCM1_00909 [Leishmania martiniquensis]|uniref:Uncharacterized protein n=1 Tax=Leishmania martiniquensis TaxID=1580590 RepID=A0A836KID1_9TRYP|nr:hypothetical protein LSCM1_00909 [Leishmania martiniquensis]
MSRIRQPCPPTHAVLLLPAPNVGAKGGKYATPSLLSGRQQQQQPAAICLSCFVDLLRKSAPLPSADVVHRGAVSIMEALAHSCPAWNEGEGALLAWTRSWLTFGRVTGSCAALAFSMEVSAPRPQPMGSALADVLVALYRYVVRHGGFLNGETSMSVAETTGARTAVGTAAASPRCRGRNPEDAPWAVLVDLVQFLFSCWELQLVGVPTSSHVDLASLTPHAASPQCRTASFGYSEVASLPSPMLLGETDDGVPEEERPPRCSCEEKYEETVQRPKSHENAAQVTFEYVLDILRRVISEIFRVADDDAAAIDSEHGTGQLRIPVATAVFLKFVQVSPLFRRLVCSSPPLFRFLARYLLPRLLLLHYRQQQQQRHHQASSKRRSRMGAAVTAIEAMLSTLYIVSSSAAPSTSAWSTQPLSVVASQLSCRCCSSESEMPPASALADSDGATLLQILCAVLQCTVEAQSSTLRLEALRLLCLLSSWPTTRRELFLSVGRGGDASTTYLTHKEQRGPANAAATAAVASSLPRSSALDAATHLLPLLLSGEDEEESVQLTCTVLQMILFHVQSSSPSASLSAMCSGAADAMSTAAALVPATSPEGSLVGTADDVSAITVAVHLANNIKDYTMQALYSCTGRTGYALVELLECAASVVAGARVLIQGAGIEAGASAVHDDVVERWEQQQDWRVVFHVAEVDTALFEVLLKGTILHNALVQCNGTGVSDDGSEPPLCWDEVASSIAAVAAQERGGRLSLFSFLRCLDALAAGMRGNVQVLWSSRLRQLVHELLERVDLNAQGAKWRPVDAAAAMRTFSSLLVTGDSSVATDVPGVHDAASALLLRRVVDPQTVRLLTRVTAAYLPASSDLLPLGVQLLLDFVHAGELVSMDCPASSDYPTVASEFVEESRSLLRIATLLTRTHLVSWTAPAQTRPSGERRACRARSGAGPSGEKLSTPTSTGSGQAFMPPSASRGSGSARYADDRVGLLDALFGLCPEAPELLVARAELISALAQRHGTADAQPQLLAADSSTFIGAASLAEVVIRASHLQTSLLLSLAALGARPCLGRQELCHMLVERCRVLCSRLERTAYSKFTHPPTTLWSAEAEENDAVGPAITDTASDIDDNGAGRLLDALQDVLTLLVVRTLWYSAMDSDPTQLWPAPPLQMPVAYAVADCSLSEPHAQALMACVEMSKEFREGLCQYLFDLHTHYRVDVLRFLTFLQGEEGRVPQPQLHQAQSPSPALFAATVFSVLLYGADVPAHSAEAAGAASPLLTYMRSLRSVHWLANAHLQQASVPLSVELLLRSVFRVAKRELLSLNHCHYPQAQRADVVPEPNSTASLAAVGSLQFVCDELAFQQHRFQTGASPVRRAVAELTVSEGALPSASDTAPGAAFSMYVLREHVVPLLLRTNSNTGTHRNGFSMVVGALEYSAVLLRLMSVALWPLAPATCMALDAVLAEYAMRHARQLLALTTDEWARADSAARKLLFPVLQLLHLLLTRAHKVDVVRRYGTHLLLFAFRARHVAIARTDLLAFGEVEQGAAADSDEDVTRVCVIASIVYIAAAQVADLRRKGATGGTGVGSAASDVAAAAVGGGPVPPPLKDVPWYAWVPVLKYYQCLQAAVRCTTDNRAAREERRRVLWMVVSGTEYVVRLCEVSELTCCSHKAASAWPMENLPQLALSRQSAAHVSEGPGREEYQAATILIDWCAELIFTSRTSGDDFDDEGLSVIVVAARLLYLIFYRFRTLAAHSIWFNALVLSCMRQTAPSRRLQLPVVAEGWLLAALVRVLPNVPHGYAYTDYVRESIMRYFEKPEVAARVKRLPIPQPKEPPAHATGEPRITIPEKAATADTACLASPCGGWAAVSAAEPELSCALRILVAACRQYERSPHWLRSGRRLGVIVPLGLQLLEEAPLCACPPLLEYAFPYTVPSTSAGAPPLLLVFRCRADQICE